MTDHDYNDLSKKDLTTDRGADDGFIPEGAWPVCPNCFQPCNPLRNYCENCGSNDAINPLAPYLPFVNIRFNYGGFVKMWRGIRRRDVPVLRKWLYLFMIIVFAPVVLVIGLPFFLTGGIKNPALKTAAIIMLYIIAVVLLMFLLPVRISPFY
jgi:hypothetical protein